MSSPLAPLGFHTGTVVAWNALAGTNSIRVLGTVYNNLPSLIGSEVGLIRTGDQVALFRFQSTTFVLGRVEASGVAQRALDINYALVATLNPAGAPAVWEARNGPSVQVYVGSSRRVVIDLTAEMSVDDNIEWMSVQVSGSSNIAAYPGNALVCGGDGANYLQATRRLVFEAVDGLNEGWNTFQTMHWTSSNVTSPLVGEVSIIVQPF